MKLAKTVLYGVLFVALVIGFWNLFDFLFSAFITKSGYVFGTSDLLYPALLGIGMYILLFLIKKEKLGKRKGKHPPGIKIKSTDSIGKYLFFTARLCLASLFPIVSCLLLF